MSIRDQIRQGDSREVLDQFAAAGDAATTVARIGPDNPTRSRCEVHMIVADGPAAKGRVAAIINPRLCDEDGTPFGLVGFFECDRNPDTARWLFDYASEWLAKRGCKTVRGPIDFTTWHDYRLLSKVNVDLPIQGEPAHPDYYPDLFRQAGFQHLSRYTSNWLEDHRTNFENFRPVAQRARDNGYTMRGVQMSDLPVLHRLAMEAFATAFMYSPIELDEFIALYTPDRAAAAAGGTKLAISPDGEPVGFMYTFDAPLEDEIVGIVKTIAVSPSVRGQGIYKLMLGSFFEDCLERDVPRGVGALMHADGSPSKMGWSSDDTILKEYELYERSL